MIHYNEKELLLKILNGIEKLNMLLPHELSLSEVSNLTGKPANTIRKYVIDNFEPEAEYKKKGGRIYVKQEVVLRIRKHYGK
jgi:predicted metal-dependent hydrolase